MEVVAVVFYTLHVISRVSVLQKQELMHWAHAILIYIFKQQKNEIMVHIYSQTVSLLLPMSTLLMFCTTQVASTIFMLCNIWC